MKWVFTSKILSTFVIIPPPLNFSKNCKLQLHQNLRKRSKIKAMELEILESRISLDCEFFYPNIWQLISFLSLLQEDFPAGGLDLARMDAEPARPRAIRHVRRHTGIRQRHQVRVKLIRLVQDQITWCFKIIFIIMIYIEHTLHY